jgi:hypothetical protein
MTDEANNLAGVAFVWAVALGLFFIVIVFGFVKI